MFFSLAKIVLVKRDREVECSRGVVKITEKLSIDIKGVQHAAGYFGKQLS